MSARALDRYAAKRSFSRTPEPPARPAGVRHGPLLFVVQKHAARRLHYDFRLELEGVLKSWAVPKGPSLDPADKRMAVEVEDHPFDYASFEGVIPEKQYGAGGVIVWDCGAYSPDEGATLSFTDRTAAEARVRAELSAGKLSFLLCGEKLKGSFALVKTRTGNQWLLIKHKDRFAQANDVLARHTSVLSGLGLDELTAEKVPTRLAAGRLAPAGPAERLPQRLRPMLAETGEAARSRPQWRYEPKLDGYRVIAYAAGAQVRLESRRGLDLTAFFPEITAELATQPAPLVLDGEIVALDAHGRPSFNALQNRAQLKSATEINAARRERPVVLVCFDLLHFAGLNLRGAPYGDRRRYLAQCLQPAAHLQLVHASEHAEELYAAALDQGFEGIIAKRLDSPYEAGRRSRSWLKIKAAQSAEFLIGGYTRGNGARAPLGALLLGYRDGKALRYAGHVGSGLDDGTIRELLRRTARLKRADSPFAEPPPLHRPTTWLKPQLVAEVSYSEWTPAGALRAPVFLRLRADIAPGSVRRRRRADTRAGHPPAPDRRTAGPRSASAAAPQAVPDADDAAAAPAATHTAADEAAAVLAQLENPAQRLDLKVGGARIGLTNLDRVYWPAEPARRRPATTKRDLLRYLARVGRFMLPHLADRPLTMIRMPEGIGGERFFQKHWSQPLPEFVESVTVFSETKDEQHRYLLANNLPTLLWLGQVGTLEFHVWHSRAQLAPDTGGAGTDYASSLAALESSILNYPDYLVFDIDPYIYSGKEAKGAEPELNKHGFAVGKRVAFWLRALLKELSLKAVVKTSGKTGLHVFVPIERTVTFDEARHLCETVGRHLMRAHPKEITMDWAVDKRTGKIFIDYNMNVRGKTLNVAYSPRGVPGAPVSMPLTWEELEGAEPTDFTIGNVAARLEKNGDRWHDVLETKQSLTKAFGIDREQ
ncbi:MAG TPA: non-homologous end-joining DNA ligase [Steroidobacteraceae bacterium]|nr:non-homologous end-joining DNA ligase [Steroidobacteraceae bacterium]